MEHIKELYANAFQLYGDSSNSVLWPKGRQTERFHALTKHIHLNGGFSILDYGCGLAHLKPYIDRHYKNVSYTGVDVLQAFIDASSRKYHTANFLCLESPDNLEYEYDFVVASGLFNLYYVSDPQANREKIFSMLGRLFEYTSVYLSVNFMTDHVDYKQDGAYHQNLVELYEFVYSNLSRRINIDQSYMPYEYTITIWKNQNILRPENLYESL